MRLTPLTNVTDDSRTMLRGGLTPRRRLTPWARTNDLSVISALPFALYLIVSSRTPGPRAGLDCSEDAGDQASVAAAVSNLGYMSFRRGDLARARSWTEQALARDFAQGNLYGVANNVCNLGAIVFEQGDRLRAHELLTDGLVRALNGGYLVCAITALEALAQLCEDAGQPRQATLFAAAAAARRQRSSIAGVVVSEQALSEATRTTLGDADFEAAWTEGYSLGMDALLNEARSISLSEPKSPPAARDPLDLTSREAQVLRLVVQGLSDKQLASKLGVSPTTASKHVANLLGKTMTRNRLALALWAIERGLVTRD